MKKFILLILVSFLSLNTITAQETIIKEDWSGCETGNLPEGWTTIGTDKAPLGIAADYFVSGEGMKVMSLPGSEKSFAVSYSSTVEGGKVNTRLISPAVRVPSSGAVLRFDAVNYNPGKSVENKICVYAIDVASGEMSKSLLTVRIPANNVEESKFCSINLFDYRDKEINIVIANEGTDAGLLGIGRVTVSQYIAEVTDKTALFSTSEKSRSFDLSLSIYAPSNGFSAILKTSNGEEETIRIDTPIDKVQTTVSLPFTTQISLKSEQVMEYSVRVIPDCAPNSPYVFNASTGCGVGFGSVVVEEEGTGEKCGYCPAGTAGIEKFSDMFGDRFIGIAIHCTSFSTRVMENAEYADPFVYNERFPLTGLPAAILNRSASVSPTTYNALQNEVARQLNVNSVAQTEITETLFDNSTFEMTVRFKTQLALPLTSTQLNAAVVLLADSLTGNTKNWYQTNYFSGMSETELVNMAGEDWWPYMKFYCEYPTSSISPTDHRFNHVAMGIYPDYNGDGCPLQADWNSDESCENEISFKIPMQETADGFGVQNVDNTSVVVLVIDSRNGEIIAADKMSACDYENGSGVEEIPSEVEIDVSQTPDSLVISAEEGAYVGVYSLMGNLLSAGYASNSTYVVNIPRNQNPLIVNAVIGGRTMTRKIIH